MSPGAAPVGGLDQHGEIGASTVRGLLLTGTVGARAFDFLSLGFDDVTVLPIDVDGADVSGEVEVHGAYDTIVIDPSTSDMCCMEALADSVRPWLSDGGMLIIGLRPGSLMPTVGCDPRAFDGWRWHGLSSAGGVVCVILRPLAPVSTPSESAKTGALVAAAMRAAAIASAATERMRSDRESVLADQWAVRESEARQRSETALLHHLDVLARELDRVRDDHRGLALVRTLVRRTAVGRRALRRLRRSVSAARAVAHRAR